MHVAINAHYIHRARLSGLARYARQLCDALRDLGCTVVEIKPPSLFYEHEGGFWRLLRFLALLVTEMVVPPILLVLRLVRCHVSPAFAAPLGFFSRRYIVVVHDLAFLEFPECYSRREHWYFALNLAVLQLGRHRIVVPSAYVKESLCRRTSISPQRIRIVSPYSGLPRRKAGGPPHNYFLLLSNAHPRKNIDQTVKGFLASSAPALGYRLLIVGSFELPVEQASAQVEVRSNVTDDELAELISEASALLLFSLSEGFGFPVVEAAQLGTVALTSEVTSLSELLAPPRRADAAVTAKEIAGRIDLYLSSAKYRAMLERDRDFLNSKFCEEAFRADWKDLICG